MGQGQKTINLLGDSITEGAGASRLEACYASLLEKSGAFAQVRNYGIGGTRIEPNKTASSDPKWDQDFMIFGREDSVIQLPR